MNLKRPINLLPLMLISSFGAVLRVVFLSKQSLWLDEMTSLDVASQSILNILNGVGFDRHTPPVYYILLHYWLLLGEGTVFWLRLLSALFDAVNIILVGIVFSKQLSEGTGRVAALLYAISPFSIYYAQEGRMYTLLITLVLISYYFALRFSEGKVGLVSCFLLLLTATAGMYTHYYFALSLFAVTVALTFAANRNLHVLRKWYLVMVAVGLAFLPWVRVILSLAASGGQQFRQFLFLELPYTFLRFVAGYAIMPLNYGAKEDWFAVIRAHSPVLILFVVSFSALLLLGLNASRRLPAGKLLFLYLPLLLPPIVASLVSIKVPMLSERYLTVVYPFFVALLALGLVNATLRFKKAALLIPVTALGLFFFATIEYFTSSNFGKIEWKGAADYIAQYPSASRQVFVVPTFADQVLRYYLKAPHVVIPLDENHQKMLTNQAEKGEVAYDRTFWVIEEGIRPTVKKELIERGYRLETERLFPLENGLRVFLFSFGGTTPGLSAQS